MHKQQNIKSNYQGSEATRKMVSQQILERYGQKEMAKYNPFTNCLTFRDWNEAGYRVKKGEKAIRSIVIIEKKDKNNEVIARYPRTINLFFYLQVEEIE